MVVLSVSASEYLEEINVVTFYLIVASVLVYLLCLVWMQLNNVMFCHHLNNCRIKNILLLVLLCVQMANVRMNWNSFTLCDVYKSVNMVNLSLC